MRLRSSMRHGFRSRPIHHNVKLIRRSGDWSRIAATSCRCFRRPGVLSSRPSSPIHDASRISSRSRVGSSAKRAACPRSIRSHAEGFSRVSCLPDSRLICRSTRSERAPTKVIRTSRSVCGSRRASRCRPSQIEPLSQSELRSCEISFGRWIYGWMHRRRSMRPMLHRSC